MRNAALLGLCALVCACETNTPEPHAPEPKPKASRRCPPPRRRVIDLAQPMQPGMAVWPGAAPFKMTRTADYDQGYRSHTFEMGENAGTHVDAPAHFAQGKRTLGQIPAEELVLPAVVIDVRAQVQKNPDYQLGPGDIGDWEAAHGELPPGSIVLANTGWAARFREPPKYLGQDAGGVMHFPGFSAEAARLFIERDVAAIGIDTLSLDIGPSKSFDAHKIFLGSGRYGVENLANLDQLPPKGATVVIGVLPVVDGTEAQARVIALVPEDDEEAAPPDEPAK